MKGEKTLAELAQQFDVHPNQITTWRGQLLAGAAGVFGSDSQKEPAEPAIDVKALHAKIDELTLVNDFLSGALGKAGLLPSKNNDRRAARTHAPPVTLRARELGISRGSVYYLPRPTLVANLAIRFVVVRVS